MEGPEGFPPSPDYAIGGDGSFTSLGATSDTIYKVTLTYALDDDRMIYGLYRS